MRSARAGPNSARALFRPARRPTRLATTAVPTVAPSVQSNLITVLGRTAAYENGMVTWDAMLKKNEKLEIDLKGLKA